MNRNYLNFNGIFIAFVFSIAGGCISSPAGINDKSSALKQQTHIIEIRQMKFVPASITVAKGDQVKFMNNDMVVHDITEKSKAWTHRLHVNESWIYIPEASTDYYCSLHPVMKGTITVKK